VGVTDGQYVDKSAIDFAITLSFFYPPPGPVFSTALVKVAEILAKLRIASEFSATLPPPRRETVGA
jgi:hypothetical protein